jgi:hypothetical protein
MFITLIIAYVFISLLLVFAFFDYENSDPYPTESHYFDKTSFFVFVFCWPVWVLVSLFFIIIFGIILWLLGK